MALGSSVCPWCKVSGPPSTGACSGCGRYAADHPSIAASGGRTLTDDFDEDSNAPGLELEMGSGPGARAGQHSSGDEDGGGLMLDDDFGEGSSSPLELDVPSSHSASSSELRIAPAPPSSAPAWISGSHSSRSTSGMHSAATPAPIDSFERQGPDEKSPSPEPRGTSARPARPSSAATRTQSAPELIAKYPPPPQKPWETPLYAWKVLLRKLQLREELEALRNRRSLDVPLYEAALTVHDKKAFAVGMAFSALAMMLGLLVLCIPMILRALSAR